MGTQRFWQFAMKVMCRLCSTIYVNGKIPRNSFSNINDNHFNEEPNKIHNYLDESSNRMTGFNVWHRYGEKYSVDVTK